MPFQSFLDYLLLEKNYSKLTIKAYAKDLSDFLIFNTGQFDQEGIEDVSYTQIRSWIVSMVEKEISNRSINRKISALNTYYRFLLKIGEIESNPLAKHRALKTSKKIQVL